MSIVKLYTFVLAKLQASLVVASKKSTERARDNRIKAAVVRCKAARAVRELEAKATEQVIESEQLADRAAKLKALL
jgi:hypothetical protein